MFTNRIAVSTIVAMTVSSIAAVLLTLVLVPQVAADNNQDSLARLRAAFVYNISKFVTWPDADFAALNTPFKLCILTKDHIPQFTELQSKKTHGRAIEVSVFKNKQQLVLNTEEEGACHILYISNDEESGLSQAEVSTLQQSTLLIGKNKHFLENGGMLALIRMDSKIKIFINPEAIAQSQLKLESRLRSLAQTL